MPLQTAPFISSRCSVSDEDLDKDSNWGRRDKQDAKAERLEDSALLVQHERPQADEPARDWIFSRANCYLGPAPASADT